jgi:lysophospholipase L1-like esterase
MNPTRLTALLIALVILLFFLFRSDTPEIQTRKLATTAVVLAFGDSLTYGYGSAGQAYPKQLQALIGRSVINAGVPGELSANGLRRLPELLEMHRPSLVILCHGGNDILRRSSQETLRSNLVAMIKLARASGAQVLLVGIPGFGLLGASTVPLYEEVATEQGVLYEGRVLEKIENDASLKSDQIHPNALGYGLMAEAFARTLQVSGVL